MRPHSLAVAALAATMLTTGAASADDPRADQLFTRGKALVAGRRFAEACPLLAESVRIEPGIGARLWLADCLEQSGRLGDAFVEFDAAARAAAERSDERERVAARRRDALRPKLVLVEIRLPQEHDEITVKQDGVPLSREDLGSVRPITPGVHTFGATASGRAPWSVSVTVSSRPDTTRINVPRLDVETRAPTPAPEPQTIMVAAPSPPRVEVRPARTAMSPWTIASIAVGAVGVGALGGGAFLGFQAKAMYDSSNGGGHCVNDACDPTGKELRADASSAATLSTIAFSGAGALLGASVLMYVLSPSATTGVTPTVGAGGAGVSALHRF